MSVTVSRSRARDISTSAKAKFSRKALSGVSVLRCSSLNQSICKRLAPGMNRLVNIWRNNGSSWPQPWRMSTEIASRRAISEAIAARPPSTNISAADHQAGNLFGMAICVFDREGAALRYSKQDEAVEASGLHHAFEIADKGLEGNVLASRVRKAV